MPRCNIIAGMNLTRLKTFVRVAELGSLSKAADRLRIAQPALSRQMKLLQAEMGIRLFERHRRGMQLTAAGEELMGRVAGLIRELEKACDDARSSAGAISGHVVFGVVPTVSYVLAGRLARRVAMEYPRLSLQIVEGYSGHQLDWLHRGEVDAAIMYGTRMKFHMPVEELLLEDLSLVGPPESDIDPGRPVRVADFARLPLVLPSRLHGLRSVVEAAALKAKAKLTVRFEADSFRVLINLVEEGLGYTALPLSAISREVEQGRLKHAPLTHPKATRQLVLSTPAAQMSRAARAVVKLVRAEIAALVRSGEWRARLQFNHRE